MAATDTLDRSDRASALDQFARAGESPREVVPAAQAFAAPAERIVGAQAVAVYRDESRVLGKLKALAAAAGNDWYYRFPVKNNREGRTDWVEGPSIKLANDLARIYGNCGVDTRVQDLGEAWLIYARFTDYETGFDMVRPFQQRKSQRSMRGDNERALDIALQIGVSKAIRNVVVNALQTYADFAFEEARNALVDKIGKELPRYREATARRLAEHVEIVRVEAVIGRPVAEWLAPDVARVIAMMKAVQDGMASLDDTFPPLRTDKPAEDGKAASKAAMDQFAGEKDTAAGDQQQSSTSEAEQDSAASDHAGDATTTAQPGTVVEGAASPDQVQRTETPPANPKKPAAAKAPKTADEYKASALAHIDAASDADELEAWFKSAEQRRIRNEAGMSFEETDEIGAAVKAKAIVLRQSAGEG